jgi:curved DNA-binding protein CbpA
MNYYRILGVDNNAELIIIRAAYKTLIQKYHPDKAKDDSERKIFNEKTKLINEAYDVLRDEIKRKAYDQNFSSNNSQKNEHTKTNNYDADWSVVIDNFPVIRFEYEELLVLSQEVANEFKQIIIKNKKFSESKSLAKKLKYDFFRKNYGDNTDCQDFAYWLHKADRIDIANELKNFVRILGSDIDNEKLIADLSDKYDLKYETKKKILSRKIRKNLIQFFFLIKYLIAIPSLLLSFGLLNDFFSENQYLGIAFIALYWVALYYLSNFVSFLINGKYSSKYRPNKSNNKKNILALVVYSFVVVFLAGWDGFVFIIGFIFLIISINLTKKLRKL